MLAHPAFDRINVLLCRTLRGALRRELRPTEIILDRADGLDWETLCRVDAVELLTPERQVSKPKPQFGSAKNLITIGPEFDEPLEDFKPYME